MIGLFYPLRNHGETQSFCVTIVLFDVRSVIMHHLQRSFFYVCWLILALFIVFSAYFAYNFFTLNVHTVIPGTIYRSAQLNHAELTYYQKKLHLKTIINLRGNWPKKSWYRTENRLATKQHLHYYSIQFEAYLLPSKARLRELVYALQIAPKPLLLHCEGGADRTGMAAVISTILFDNNASIRTLQRQASWHYNVISKDTVGYQVLMNYLTWLQKNQYCSSKKHFLQWLASPEKMKSYSGWFVV